MVLREMLGGVSASGTHRPQHGPGSTSLLEGRRPACGYHLGVTGTARGAGICTASLAPLGGGEMFIQKARRSLGGDSGSSDKGRAGRGVSPEFATCRGIGIGGGIAVGLLVA